jgi:hypothetical protein
VFTHRPASETDDLTGLWPETQPHALNREQVLLITEDEGRVLGGAIVFHGGHSVAIVGAVRIRPDVEHPQWVARALWRYVKTWCSERGVTMVGHAAGTEECVEAMTRLGGTAAGVKTMFEVPV